MNKNNVIHKIGDKVAALTDPENTLSQPRKKNEVYAVLDVHHCPTCNKQLINITNKPLHKSIRDFIVCECGKFSSTKPRTHFTYSHHFAPVRSIDDLIETALKGEKELEVSVESVKRVMQEFLNI